MKKIYRGFINGCGDGLGLIFPNGDEVDLVKEIQKDLEQYGHYVFINYYVSDKEQSEEEMLKSYLALLMGLCDSNVSYAMGSEWTGEYCNGATLQVGGHDLLSELWDYYGKFLQLNIEYYEYKVENMYVKSEEKKGE